jgi:chromosome segregation ATPase
MTKLIMNQNTLLMVKKSVKKDVQEIALETGLTKSSLAIISQGSVNNFVEAKPDERRQLFDEAAGVAKYKKRKEESIRKLIRSNENPWSCQRHYQRIRPSST